MGLYAVCEQKLVHPDYVSSPASTINEYYHERAQSEYTFGRSQVYIPMNFLPGRIFLF